MCSRFDTGGGRTDPRGTNAVRRRFPRGGRPTGPERRRKCEEAGRRSAEPPIRTGRPNAVASGCRKETAASPCGARPGGASSEARHREGTGVPDSCGPGSRRVSRRGGAIKVSARPSLRRTAGRSFLRGEAPRRDGRTRQLRPGIAKGEAVRRGESDGRQDRSDDENAKRRGGREAKCRASYSHRPAERGCKRMPEGNGRVPLRRTAGRSSLRGEAPRRDGRTRQLRPGIAKGEPAGRGDKSFGEAVLAAHGRAELPPRRGPEKGRAESTNTVRNRTG